MDGLSERATVWQRHLTAWKASGLSQRAYSRQHDINVSTFNNWIRKQRQGDSPQSKSSLSGFAPVVLSPSSSELVLTLPSGLEIRGIDEDTLNLVPRLLEALA